MGRVTLINKVSLPVLLK